MEDYRSFPTDFCFLYLSRSQLSVESLGVQMYGFADTAGTAGTAVGRVNHNGPIDARELKTASGHHNAPIGVPAVVSQRPLLARSFNCYASRIDLPDLLGPFAYWNLTSARRMESLDHSQRSFSAAMRRLGSNTTPRSWSQPCDSHKQPSQLNQNESMS